MRIRYFAKNRRNLYQQILTWKGEQRRLGAELVRLSKDFKNTSFRQTWPEKSMSDEIKTQTMAVKIMDKEYHVSCPAGKEDALKESARKLSNHMKEISEGGRVVGLDRIAVMAALNISGEMIAAEEANSTYRKNVDKRLQSIKKSLVDAMVDGRQFKL